MSDETIKKIIPSRLEKGMQQFLYRHLGTRIPAWMTPNQVTAIGAAGGLFGIICAACAGWSRWFLVGVIAGLVIHLVADDLDGYVARTRGMSSRAGAYLDLITDILHITYLIIALAWSGYLNIRLALLIVPVYALIIVTCMNYIQYFHEFLFPRMGPIETHLFFVALCVAGMVFGTGPVVTVAGYTFRAGDIIVLVGSVPMYYEMIRMQIQLFRRLRQADENEKR